ncbi:hypothetical protein NX862_14535 [Rhodobacter sp. KR11]|uniref:hypothetical protein n=1 Tax=Rhodobacter sp. KR11 TaxID=2974588 RepID=UPI002223E682|nr:hypothetical protein [Rhodobacter sp. KR11]MCW1919975.1 hypothetical protein [Rhodobacter sp. KR11]
MTGLFTEDEFTITHGGFAVRLRPSLRAAMRLERLHDGYPALLAKLDAFDTLTVRKVMQIAATNKGAADAFLSHAASLPLSVWQEGTQEALRGLCGALLRSDADGTPAKPNAKPMTWAQAYAELYRIGTGWLGWTPAETLAATPAEITEAFEGRISLFKAEHGITDDDKAKAASGDDLADLPDDEFDRAGFEALRASLM